MPWWNHGKSKYPQESRTWESSIICTFPHSLALYPKLDPWLWGKWREVEWVRTKKVEAKIDPRRSLFESKSHPFLKGCVSNWKKNMNVELIWELFMEFLNEDLLPNSQVNIKSVDGLECPISKTRAWAWMKNLGFSYESHVKNIYYDGHDRADVLEYRSIFFLSVFGKQCPTKVFSYLEWSKLFLRISAAVWWGNRSKSNY